jgi:hypothetical protein
MKGADFVWDKEKLDRFIAKPDEVVKVLTSNIRPGSGAAGRTTRCHWSQTLCRGTDSVGTSLRAHDLGSALIERGITAVLAAPGRDCTPTITGGVGVRYRQRDHHKTD